MLGATIASAAVVEAQSLGEVARREQERRKAVAAPAKVYTNESLGPVAPASAVASPAVPSDSGSSAPAATAPAAGADASGGDASDAGSVRAGEAAAEPKKGEAYWAGRIRAEREGLARAQLFADALQSRVNALTNDFTARDDPAQRQVIAANREKALAELDRVRREVEQHTKAIAGIEEEARRAGVPAGWVR